MSSPLGTIGLPLSLPWLCTLTDAKYQRYVRTQILSKEEFDHVSDVGVQFAEAKDAGQCLVRVLSDPAINGHSFFISARKWASKGFIDLDIDDYESDLIQDIQKDQLLNAPVEAGLFLE